MRRLTLNQGVNVSWFVLFHLVTKVVISLGFIIRHIAVATACVQLSILEKAVYLKRRETDRLSDKTKQTPHPLFGDNESDCSQQHLF